jgi:RNA polymerase sigma-70 factor (ECF subfamily)
MDEASAGPTVDDPDADLLPALRAGDRAAFETLVERVGPMLDRLVRIHVSDPTVAEEVVQEAWIGVIRGLDRFRSASTLRTWCGRIAVNIARTRATREARQVVLSTLGRQADDRETDGPPIDAFADDGHWVSTPRRWDDIPTARLETAETLEALRRALDDLPPRQREILTLRDIEGWTSEEACNALGLTPTNQRVLLHRARTAIRRALADHLEDR